MFLLKYLLEQNWNNIWVIIHNCSNYGSERAWCRLKQLKVTKYWLKCKTIEPPIVLTAADWPFEILFWNTQFKMDEAKAGLWSLAAYRQLYRLKFQLSQAYFISPNLRNIISNARCGQPDGMFPADPIKNEKFKVLKDFKHTKTSKLNYANCVGSWESSSQFSNHHCQWKSAWCDSGINVSRQANVLLMLCLITLTSYYCTLKALWKLLWA